MSKGVKIAIGILLAVFVPGGIALAYGLDRIFKICVNINSYKFKTDLQYAFLDLQLQVKNPSFIAIGINSYSIDIFLNDKKIGKVENFNTKIIEPQKISYLSIPVKMDLIKSTATVLSSEIINYFGQKQYDKIIVSLNGKFTGKVMKIPVTFPITLKYSLKEIQQIMDTPSTPC